MRRKRARWNGVRRKYLKGWGMRMRNLRGRGIRGRCVIRREYDWEKYESKRCKWEGRDSEGVAESCLIRKGFKNVVLCG